MQRSRLLHIMEEGLPALGQAEPEIRHLAETYPYCATYQIMRALADRAADHLDYKKSLSLAAIYTQDRSKLYTYALQTQVQGQIQSFEKSTAGSETRIENIDQIEKIPADLVEKDGFSEIEIENQPVLLPSKPLEVEIMREAIGHLSELETADYLAGLPLAAESPKDNQKKADLSFGQWLLNLSDQSQPEPLKQMDLVLIDKFIAEAPQISPVKAAFFSPSQVAKMSLVDDEMFVTETLAKIYLRQGHFKKAAKAFDILALKYPEKTRYFAALKKEAEEQA